MDARPGPRRWRRWWTALAAIAVAALGWRVGYTLAVHGDDARLFDEGDAFVYSAVAHGSVAGHWFEDVDGSHFADHPPLTVVALLPTSAVFRDSVLAQRLTMSVVGALAVLAIGLLGQAASGRAAVGLAAAAVAAVNPNLWMNDALVMSESLGALSLAAVLLLGVRLRGGAASVRFAILTGAVCGVAVLCRAEYALLLPLVVVPALGLRRWRLAAVAFAVAAAVVLPWSVWSSIESDRLVLVSTNDATTLVGANCDDTFFDGEVGTWSFFCVERAEQAEQAGATTGEALRYVRAHLGRLPLVVVAREGRTLGFWRPDQQVRSNVYEGRPEWASWLGYATFWLLLPVSVIGAVSLRRHGRPLLPFAACAVIVVVVSAAFYGLPRFRLPLDVATCVLAAYALVSRWSRSTASSITS